MNPIKRKSRFSTNRGGYLIRRYTKHHGSYPHTLLVMPNLELHESYWPHVHHKKGHSGLVRQASGRIKHTAGALVRSHSTSEVPSHATNNTSNNKKKENTQDGEDENFEPMDPEELAMLNSIINTRRSMATAKALAQHEMEHLEVNRSNPNSHSASRTPSRAVSPSPMRHRCVKFAPLPFPEDEEMSIPPASNVDKDGEYGARTIGLSSSALNSSESLPETEDSRSVNNNSTTSLLSRVLSSERPRSETGDDTSSIHHFRGRRLSRFVHGRRDSELSLPDDSPPPSPGSTWEDRLRRREHIRAQRPGGTGMVTLLDGERIPARMAGDRAMEMEIDEDLQDQLWGFAALERYRMRVKDEEAERQKEARKGKGKLSKEQAKELQRRFENEMLVLGVEALNKAHQGSGKKMAKHHASGPESTTERRSSAMSASALALPSSEGTRVHADPSISMPWPSPRLPRRPDARGIVVVPLNQLGERPERPFEGRSWLYQLPLDWDSDESDDDATTVKSTRHRATTRAAGQEVVHSSRQRRSKRSEKTWDDEFWPRPSATRRMYM